MPFKGFKTYFRIVGEKKDKAPLVLLHGGPGSTHNTLEVLDDLSDERQVIYYDQIGCGLSSVPEGHKELFNKETWCEELIELRKFLGLKEIHLLGHSWGGMLAITYLSDYAPSGIKSVVLSSTLPSTPLWVQEGKRLLKLLPDWAQQAIEKAKESHDFKDPVYLKANELFVHLHIGGPWGKDAPDCLTRPKIFGKEAYETAWGPNEYAPDGNLKDWDYLEKMKAWKYKTLITDGAEDESTPYIDKIMHEAVQGSKWVLFEYSRHMSYVEEHDKYVATVHNFLKEND